MFLIIALYFLNVDYFTCKKDDQGFFNHTSIHFGVILLFFIYIMQGKNENEFV
jgi:hypothetical protein